MKAIQANLLVLMKKNQQFVIPIYQRKYSWGEKECLQLWHDIIKAGEDRNIKSHFIGSIVYIAEEATSSVTSQSASLLIDGQQRLTTVTLFVSALAEKLAKTHGEDVELYEGFSAEKLRYYYLINDVERGDKHYKLMLAERDKETLFRIVKSEPLPKKPAKRLKKNYRMIQNWIDQYLGELTTIWRGLAKLIVVDVALERGRDDPQRIFESMNSTGMELTQADLIRNFILMDLPYKDQTDLYLKYWRPIEENFGEAVYTRDFDRFMRHFLTVQTGKIPKLKNVYSSFKQYTYHLEEEGQDRALLLHNMLRYSGYYSAMKLGSEQDPELVRVFQDIEELKVDVAFPMLLELYSDYGQGVLNKQELLKILRLVEAYVFRRFICAIPTNSLNSTFSNFLRDIDKTSYLENVQAKFMLFPAYRRFPNDEEFKEHLMSRDLYNMDRTEYWMRKLENNNRKEPINISEYTIEHIMPQNENLSAAWKKELGEDWEQIHNIYVHTLGNLTLTGYNSEYSDKPFDYKKNHHKYGFKYSPLRLNETVRDCEKWDKKAILRRANHLSDKALEVWKAPYLSSSQLQRYLPEEERVQTGSIDNYARLTVGNAKYSEVARTLFDTLSPKIRSISPSVSEEFLKLYIAYKADKNFVDIVPMASGLSLLFNLPFNELEDPRGVCRDVTKKGTWGNGNAEWTIKNLDDVSYAMDLIVQSYEWQMGSVHEKSDISSDLMEYLPDLSGLKDKGGAVGKYLDPQSQSYSFATTKKIAELRKSIQKIPGITEVFRKNHIAYKLNGNFLVVEPQASAVGLQISIPFDKIDPPDHHFAGTLEKYQWREDITWLRFSRESDLPYARDLIRQSYERLYGPLSVWEEEEGEG